MEISIQDVSIEISGFKLIDGCSLSVRSCEILGLVGPNGSGKSTLLRTIYRALKPTTGSVLVDGDDVWQLDARTSATRTAVVTQESFGDFDFLVEEVVAMGRIPHKAVLERENASDRDLVSSSLHRVGLSAYRDRLYSSLSGGEKQRVLLARALAQQGSVLVLDEPTNHLDIRAQLDLLDLVSQLGVTTIAALHDLNLASSYCDRICVLHDGEIVAVDTPSKALSPDLVSKVFGVTAHPATHPADGSFYLAFSSLANR